jgi:hypothetical protein
MRAVEEKNFNTKNTEDHEECTERDHYPKVRLSGVRGVAGKLIRMNFVHALWSSVFFVLKFLLCWQRALASPRLHRQQSIR